jgi:signal transduction histidine kinase/CheY-like chemotaxis protein
MAETGRIVNSSLKIEMVFERIASQVGKLIHFDRMTINLINREDGTTAHTFVAGIDIPELPEGQSFPLAEVPSGLVAKTKATLLFLPQHEQELIDRFPLVLPAYRAGLQSYMAVPLISQGEVLAVMGLKAFEANAYGQEDVRIAELFGAQISGAIANAQRFSIQEQMEQEATNLAELGRIVSSSLEIGDVYEKLGETIGKIIPFDRMSLSFVNYETKTLTPTWTLGMDVPGLREGDDFPIERSLGGEVVRTKAPYMLDAETEPDLERRFPGLIPVYKAGVVSFLAVPLISRDIVIAVLRVGSKHRGIYSQRHLDLLERMGNQIAGAIANSRLYADLKLAGKTARERSDELESLYEISRIVALPGAFTEKAESVLNVLTDVSGADWATLRVPRDDEPGLHLIAAAGPSVASSPPLPVFTEEQQMAMSCILDEKIRVNNDYAAEPNASPAVLAMGTGSVVMIPIRAGGATLGLVNVISRIPHHFTPEIVRLLTAVGDGLGVHLDKARLDEEQQQMLIENQALTESIKQSNAELSGEIADRKRTEEILAERTADLAAVGKMASEIAHELNNPLAVIMGYSDLLRSQDLPGESGDDVEKIFSESQRAAEVVKSLLTYARRPEPVKAYVDVSGALSRALALMDRDLTGNNIKVRKHFGSSLPKTMADEHQLTQVFLNIVTNAVQIMTENKREGTLWVRSSQVGSNLRFSIRDDGPGISDKNIDKVFDPFFTTKVVGKGTGMGLSMCLRTVRAHGGKIWVESKEGEGATFYVELPVESPVYLPEEAPDEGEGLFKGCTILMVDDEQAITKPMCRILSSEGHVVDVARDGEEALKAISRTRYECILVDMRMPVMGGKELYRRIKATDQESAERVIFSTGDTLSPETMEFLESTGNAWLGKPFTIEELKESIRECVARGA